MIDDCGDVEAKTFVQEWINTYVFLSREFLLSFTFFSRPVISFSLLHIPISSLPKKLLLHRILPSIWSWKRSWRRRKSEITKSNSILEAFFSGEVPACRLFVLFDEILINLRLLEFQHFWKIVSHPNLSGEGGLRIFCSSPPPHFRFHFKTFRLPPSKLRTGSELKGTQWHTWSAKDKHKDFK